jgi:cobalt/nickel transport system permease protein
VGQALTLALTAAFTCWLLRVSFWRWCRWMALPIGFLLVGVLTILFSVSREPQMLLVGIHWALSGWAFCRGLTMANRPSGAAWRRWRPPSGWC